jgi:hypothetical protein
VRGCYCQGSNAGIHCDDAARGLPFGHIRCRSHRRRHASFAPAHGSLRRLREFRFLPSRRGRFAEILWSPTEGIDASLRFRSMTVNPRLPSILRVRITSGTRWPRGQRLFAFELQRCSRSGNADRASTVQRIFDESTQVAMAFPSTVRGAHSLRPMPESRRLLYDRGVVHQALDRSTLDNLSAQQNRNVVQVFRTGSSTGIPDSMSFCWSALVTA